MNINQLNSYMSNIQSPNVNAVKQEEVKTDVKKSNGTNVELSIEGYERLREWEMIEDKMKTSMRIEQNDTGQTVFRFTDKETGEVIKEVPPEIAQKNFQRVQEYIERISSDVLEK